VKENHTKINEAEQERGREEKRREELEGREEKTKCSVN